MFGPGPAPTPAPPALPDPLPSSPTYAAGFNKPSGKANNPGSYGQSIMTSPLGDTSSVNTSKKSLLGQ